MDFNLKDLITFIQAVGFPIFIACWYLLHTEKIIAANTAVLNRLCVIEEKEIELLRPVLRNLSELDLQLKERPHE